MSRKRSSSNQSSLSPSVLDLRNSIVHFTNEQAGYYLTFAGGSWVGLPLRINGALVATSGTPITNQFLGYNGSQWTASSLNLGTNLQDVQISSLSAGQVLRYDGSKWINYSLPTNNGGSVTSVTAGSGLTGGIITSSGTIGLPNVSVTNVIENNSLVTGVLSDQHGRLILVSTLSYRFPLTSSNPTAGYVLTRDSNTAPSVLSWSNPALSSGFVRDVTVTTPSADQTLLYDGAKWINQSSSLAIQSDVTLTSPTNNQLLSFDGTNWVNRSSTLATQDDVSLTSPVSGQLLSFDGTNWVNAAVSPTTLAGQTDVTVTTPTSNQTLIYDGTKWINQRPSLAIQSDVVLNSLSPGQVLYYNGTEWGNVTVQLFIEYASDVELTSPSNLQVLSYNGTKWVNRSSTLGTQSDVTIASPVSGQVLSFDGTSWVNAGAGPTTLAGQTDVTLTSPANLQVLSYDGTAWVNRTSTLATQSDVTLTSPANLQVLSYDGTAWVNRSSTLATQSDVTLTSPAANHLLAYNGTAWVNLPPVSISNSTTDRVISDLTFDAYGRVTGYTQNRMSVPAAGTGTTNWFLMRNNLLGVATTAWGRPGLGNSTMTDVSLSSPTNLQVLSYNGTTWVNRSPLLDDQSDVIITSPANLQVLSYNGTNWVNRIPLLDDQNNVTITSPTNNQVLSYNIITSKWVNRTSTLATQNDVSISAPTNGQILGYNGTNWVNQSKTLATQSDVILTSPTNLQVLSYNGTNWVNRTPLLDDQNDVALTSPANKDVLSYDGTNWINKALSFGYSIDSSSYFSTGIAGSPTFSCYGVVNNSVGQLGINFWGGTDNTDFTGQTPSTREWKLATRSNGSTFALQTTGGGTSGVMDISALTAGTFLRVRARVSFRKRTGGQPAIKAITWFRATASGGVLQYAPGTPHLYPGAPPSSSTNYTIEGPWVTNPSDDQYMVSTLDCFIPAPAAGGATSAGIFTYFEQVTGGDITSGYGVLCDSDPATSDIETASGLSYDLTNADGPGNFPTWSLDVEVYTPVIN
jgi:hypothetical protein